MVQVKYVTRDDSRQPALWWYPYGGELTRLASVTNRAVHGRNLWERLRAQVSLLRSRRFLRRARLLDVATHVDKLL